MKEKYQDIIGKEFITFKFESDGRLSFTENYQHIMGCKAVVKNLHDAYPKYANATITTHDGSTTELHFPSEMVKAQIEERETEEKMNSMSVEDLLNEMKQLTSRI